MKIKKFSNVIFILCACYCLSVSAVTKVAVYQGSFNPLTIGHEAIIQTLLQEYNDVYVVPDRSTNYKKLGPFSVRNEMLQSVSKRLENSIIDSIQSHKILLLSEKELQNFADKIHSIDPSRTGTDMWDINEYIMTKYQSQKDIEFFNIVGLDTFMWMNEPHITEHLIRGDLSQMKVVVFDRSFVLNGKKLSGYESAKQLLKQKGSLLEIDNQDFLGVQKIILKMNNYSDISSTNARNCLGALKLTGHFKNIPKSNELSAFKIFFKNKSEKAIIKRLKMLLSNEVMNVLHTLDAVIVNIYDGNGDANLCLL